MLQRNLVAEEIEDTAAGDANRRTRNRTRNMRKRNQEKKKKSRRLLLAATINKLLLTTLHTPLLLLILLVKQLIKTTTHKEKKKKSYYYVPIKKYKEEYVRKPFYLSLLLSRIDAGFLLRSFRITQDRRNMCFNNLPFFFKLLRVLSPTDVF